MRAGAAGGSPARSLSSARRPGKEVPARLLGAVCLQPSGACLLARLCLTSSLSVVVFFLLFFLIFHLPESLLWGAPKSPLRALLAAMRDPGPPL